MTNSVVKGHFLSKSKIIWTQPKLFGPNQVIWFWSNQSLIYKMTGYYIINEYLLNSKYDKTTLMPGSACDTDMKVDHYLEKKLCSLQIQQIFELMGK